MYCHVFSYHDKYVHMAIRTHRFLNNLELRNLCVDGEGGCVHSGRLSLLMV